MTTNTLESVLFFMGCFRELFHFRFHTPWFFIEQRFANFSTVKIAEFHTHQKLLSWQQRQIWQNCSECGPYPIMVKSGILDPKSDTLLLSNRAFCVSVFEKYWGHSTTSSYICVPCNLRSCRVVGPQATASDDNVSMSGVMEKMELLRNLDTTTISCVGI